MGVFQRRDKPLLLRNQIIQRSGGHTPPTRLLLSPSQFSGKGPHTPPRRPTALSDHSPTTPLPLVWPVQQKICIEKHRFDMMPTPQYRECSALARDAVSGWHFVLWDVCWDACARNSLYFQSKRNLTISDKNSCKLNMQQGITKWTQINSSRTDITTSLVPVLQNIKNREWRNGMHRRWLWCITVTTWMKVQEELTEMVLITTHCGGAGHLILAYWDNGNGQNKWPNWMMMVAQLNWATFWVSTHLNHRV